MPKHHCEFCGGLLKAKACADMQSAMRDPIKRKNLVTGLTKAFKAKTTKQVIAKSALAARKANRKRAS